MEDITDPNNTEAEAVALTCFNLAECKSSLAPKSLFRALRMVRLSFNDLPSEWVRKEAEEIRELFHKKQAG